MIITKTPLRASFVGGGTDIPAYYKGSGYGQVLSCAIDKYVYVILLPRKFDERIYLHWSEAREVVESPDELRHELVREAMKLTGVNRAVEMFTPADVPGKGAGLGSSCSLTVGLVHTFHLFKGETVTAKQIADEAFQIEAVTLGRPIGKQDQYAAAYGSLNVIRFNADESVKVTPVKIAPETWRQLDQNLLYFYTGKAKSTVEVLGEQTAKVEDTRAIQDKMRDQVNPLREALEQGDVDEVGRAMHQGWQYKRQLATKMTDLQLDAWYQAALDAGALGGKISGAGGGGFFLLYCRPERQESVRRALTELGLVEMQFHLERFGSRVLLDTQ